MSRLPSGTITFLFTDIEGSTRLVRELGERYPVLLAEHRRLLRGVFERHGGVEIGTRLGCHTATLFGARLPRWAMG